MNTRRELLLFGKRGFDFSTIPGLRLCLLPGQGLTTDGDGGVDIWNSQFVDSYAEAPLASQRPAVQTNAKSGLLVPHFDGLDDRLLLKEANGNPLTGGVITCIRVLKSDGAAKADNRMIFFSDYDGAGVGYVGNDGSSVTDVTSAFGSPSLRIDQSPENPVTRDDVWNILYAQTDDKLMTVISGDISIWTRPQIGGWRGQIDGNRMYQGQVAAEVHYDGTLTQQQIETVESELLKLIS